VCKKSNVFYSTSILVCFFNEYQYHCKGVIMNILKKTISVFLMILLIAGVFTSCGSSDKKQSDKSLQIVTTVFPAYDWTKEILGDRAEDAELTMLLDDGVDVHSYQPTAEDLEKIASCDLFIYVGGESDEWVEDALKSKTNKNRVEINLMGALGDSVKEEAEVEGMQSEEEHEHEGEEAESEEPEQDEHIWLSLRNAEVCTQAIADQLKKLDPSNKTEYEDNATAYKEELTGLDKEYQDTVEHAKRKTLLFADRFPFRYLADDYGLKYYAAFKGCSAETEASFKTITFLANKVDEENLPYIMTIEGSDHKIAKSVISNTKKKTQQILTMDSMQSTTAQDVKDGKSYLSVMEENLSVLQKALN
jgi:putative adhesion lipoprotein